MTYLPQVIEARHVRKFIVSTRFDDGIEKDIDISQWFKVPVFEPLRNLKNFQSSLWKRKHLLGQTVSISRLKLCTLRMNRREKGITRR